MERFKHWFTNSYWYHYKVHTIVGILAVIILVFMINDFANRREADYSYVIATNLPVTTESVAEITNLFAEVGSDTNADGVADYYCDALYMDPNSEMGMVNIQKFTVCFLEDLKSLYLFDDYMGAQFEEGEGFINLQELGFKTKENAPWIAVLENLPILIRAGLNVSVDFEEKRVMYACIRATNNEDNQPNREMSAKFLKLIYDTK